MPKPKFDKVAVLEELPDGSPVKVTLSKGESVCLVRVGDEVFACEDCCSHAEYPLSDGEMVDDFVIECGLHGAQFDIRTGEVLEPPATDGLQMLEVKVEDDQVWVRSAE
jgi:3-phenylpropionate/trans-cinnamate dioxygenase ferredoxin subunit